MSIAAVVTVPGNYDTNKMDESGPEDIKRPLSETATIILNLFNWITHLCLGAVAFSGFLIGLSILGPFAAHMILCTTGYIIMMSLAILTLSPHTGWTKTVKYSQRKYVHGAMQGIGAVLAIAGSAHAITQMSSAPVVSKSAHGVLGICALACLCLNFLLGILNAFSWKMPRLELPITMFHSLLGTSTMLFAFLSLILGFNLLDQRDIAIMSMVLGVIAMIGVLTSAVVTTFRRLCC